MVSDCNSRAPAWSWQKEGGFPCSCLRWLLAVPRVAGPMWSRATGPVSVTDARGGTTPVPPWVTLVLHPYSWAGAHLPHIYFSFRNSETKGVCFAQSSGLWVPRFVCGPTLCWVCSGQLLLLLPVLAWPGRGITPKPYPEGSVGVVGRECFPSVLCQGCP